MNNLKRLPTDEEYQQVIDDSLEYLFMDRRFLKMDLIRHYMLYNLKEFTNRIDNTERLIGSGDDINVSPFDTDWLYSTISSIADWETTLGLGNCYYCVLKKFYVEKCGLPFR